MKTVLLKLIFHLLFQMSKTDEDYSYDSFVDTLMTQLRQLPPLSITEPLLTHNYAVCLPCGSGDPTKINIKLVEKLSTMFFPKGDKEVIFSLLAFAELGSVAI